MDDKRYFSRDHRVKLQVDSLLMELEQIKVEIRTTLRRQALITTSATTAEGLVLAYSIAGNPSTSILGATVVPAILGFSSMAVLREDIRKVRLKEHALNLEEEISTKSGISLDKFGIEKKQNQKGRYKVDPLHTLLCTLTGALYILLSISLVFYIPQSPASEGLEVSSFQLMALLAIIYGAIFVLMLSSYVYFKTVQYPIMLENMKKKVFGQETE